MNLNSIIIMAITILSKIAGLAREKVLASLYGTSPTAESFITAFAIPMFMITLTTVAVATGFIPMYDKIKSLKGEDSAQLYTANLINVSFVIGICFTILGIVFSTPLVRLFASGFKGQTLQMAVSFTRWGMLSMSITGVASVIRSQLQIHNKFGASVSQGLVMNIFIIVALLFSKKFGNIYLGVGIFLAMSLQYIIYIPSFIKTGYKHRRTLDFRDNLLKEFIILMIPIILAVSVNELNVIINRSIASTIVEGGVAAINYGFRLQSFVTGIVVTSIVTAIYPSLSKSAASEDFVGMEKRIISASITMGILVIPATVGLIVFAQPIVHLLFFGGAFDENAVIITKDVMAYYSLGMFALGVREIAVRVCYSIQDTKTPVINAVIMVLTNIVLNYILSKFLGIKGLALATTIATAVGAVLLLLSIQKKMVQIQWGKTVRDGIKILIASLAIGVASRAVYYSLLDKLQSNKALLFAILIAVAVYGAMLLLLRVEELSSLVNKDRIMNRI
ncbi:MAG: murein biosynthesis integral membrane protein MurJ [Tissierellia bacterium]|nr:murein biosynthesis integral membrane protein MurJ [Tissierellia bacterium]